MVPVAAVLRASLAIGKKLAGDGWLSWDDFVDRIHLFHPFSFFFIFFPRSNRKEIIRKNNGARMPSKTQRDCAADDFE